MTTARLETLEQIRKFLLAGHAIFTLVSKSTGERRTYKITTDEHLVYNVFVLNGADNTRDYIRFGWLDYGKSLHFRSCVIGKDLLPYVAGFNWLILQINTGGGKLGQCEVWHAGRCARCGRLLTTPESIASGFGPKCAEVR